MRTMCPCRHGARGTYTSLARLTSSASISQFVSKLSVTRVLKVSVPV